MCDLVTPLAVILILPFGSFNEYVLLRSAMNSCGWRELHSSLDFPNFLRSFSSVSDESLGSLKYRKHRYWSLYRRRWSSFRLGKRNYQCRYMSVLTILSSDLMVMKTIHGDFGQETKRVIGQLRITLPFIIVIDVKSLLMISNRWNVGRAINFLALIGFVTSFRLILFWRHFVFLFAKDDVYEKHEQVLQKGRRCLFSFRCTKVNILLDPCRLIELKKSVNFNKFNSKFQIQPQVFIMQNIFYLVVYFWCKFFSRTLLADQLLGLWREYICVIFIFSAARW